jgi:SAM-dependent methyltransferase
VIRLLLGVAVAAATAIVVLRERDIIDRLMEITASRPSGPVGRLLYSDATSIHGKAWEYAHEKLELTADDHLLDVCCGGGTFLAQALEIVSEAAGLDYSPDMVAVTRENNAAAVAEGRLDARDGDAAALPWGDDAFDVVTNLAAFIFHDEPDPVLREAARVLKPGGRFMLVTSARPEQEDLGSRFARWLMPEGRLYSDAELADLLREAGFSEVEAYSPDGDWQIGYGIKAVP